MEKKIRLPGWSDLTPKEYGEHTDAERQQYRKRLDMLCPSKEIQYEAREISKDMDIACSKCVYYCPNEEETCRIPHTDAYMDVLGINPCYEGALLYLCKEMERKEKDSGITFNEIDALLNRYNQAVCDTLEIVNDLLTLLISNEKEAKEWSDCYRLMREKVQVIIDDWNTEDEDEDEYGFDDCGYDEDDDDYFDADETDDPWDDWDYYFGDGDND